MMCPWPACVLDNVSNPHSPRFSFRDNNLHTEACFITARRALRSTQWQITKQQPGVVKLVFTFMCFKISNGKPMRRKIKLIISKFKLKCCTLKYFCIFCTLVSKTNFIFQPSFIFFFCQIQVAQFLHDRHTAKLRFSNIKATSEPEWRIIMHCAWWQRMGLFQVSLRHLCLKHSLLQCSPFWAYRHLLAIDPVSKC